VRLDAVIDASVIVKLALDAGEVGEAISRRLHSTALHAPDHLPIEVLSALRRLRLAGQIGETESRLALQGLWSLPIQRWSLEPFADRTWQLGHNLSSYDAAYVALAERLDAPLLTANVRLARASGPTCAIEVFG
jgi:predicted nucleic acid-binding protein